MSEQEPHRAESHGAEPRRGRGPGRAEPLVAIFVAVVWAALVFAVDGLLAVLLDRDPIQSDAGRFYGLIALGLGAVVEWLVLTFTIRSRRPWAGAVVAAAGIYLTAIVTAAPVGLVLVAEQARSVFVLSAAGLGAFAVIAAWAILNRRRQDLY